MSVDQRIDWTQIKNYPYIQAVNAGQYGFTIPSVGNLSTGVNTITPTVMPQGLLAGNTVWVSGGTGTAEAASIGTVGSTSFTITCANNHSGAYTIQSNSNGIQEAAVVATNGTASLTSPTAYLFIPQGIYNIYAAINITIPMKIEGAGMFASILVGQSATLSSSFHVNTYVSPGSAPDHPVQITYLGFSTITPKTAGAAIILDSQPATQQSNFVEVSRCHFQNQFYGVQVNRGAYFNFSHNVFEGQSVNGAAFWIQNLTTFDSGDSWIVHNLVQGAGSGVLYQSGGGLKCYGNKFLGLTVGFNFQPGTGVGTGELQLDHNNFDGCTSYSIYMKPVDSTASFVLININNNLFNGSPSNAHIYSDANGSNFGVCIITGNNGVIGGNGPCIWLHTGGNYMVIGNLLAGPAAPNQGVVIDSGVVNSLCIFNPAMNTNNVNSSASTVYMEALQPGASLAYYGQGIFLSGTFGALGQIFLGVGPNYIVGETAGSANNAIVATLKDNEGNLITVGTGLRFTLHLNTHSLQAGANTITLNGTALSLKSHRNNGNNIATAYAVGGTIDILYDGSVFVDMSQ